MIIHLRTDKSAANSLSARAHARHNNQSARRCWCWEKSASSLELLGYSRFHFFF